MNINFILKILKRDLFFIFGVLFLVYVSNARADGFWCGSKLISVGETKLEVISKCGPPDDSEIVSYDTMWSFSSSGNLTASTKKVENLYYNCGDGRFIRILTFIDGKLTSIKNGGYGSGPKKCE